MLSLPLVWRWGRNHERACALAVVFGLVTDLAIQLIDAATPSSLAHAGGNLLTLTLLTRNALSSVQIYPRVMAAAQLIAVTLYPWFWLGLINPQLSFPIILIAANAATIAALWVGTMRSRGLQTRHV